MGTQEIAVPKDMETEIEKLIARRPELGYKSVREFVITACFLQILHKRAEGGE
jgi:hypothetical protein